ncbi:uncharacterized protein LOC124266405 [Haliotis rubra]|uniref:uncharacterized protein LOC124266405 n=1 Tax=Haliotis rubra TaxID=36100 RepID=UPI001EE55348|nr:uncharacterized protein LOC124266405 [Haliotis rubra]
MLRLIVLGALLSPQAVGLIAPLTSVGGETDVGNLVSHVTLLEQMVQKLQTEQTSTASQLVATQSQLKTTTDELTAVKTELHAAQTELGVAKYQLSKLPTSIELNDLVAKLNNTASAINATNQDLASIKQTVAGMAQNNAVVAFEVRLSTHIRPALTSIIKFDDVRYNQGGGFNVTTGVFTAPVAGTYILWASMIAYDFSDSLGISLFKGSEKIARAWGENPASDKNEDDTLILTTVYLDVGDQTWYVRESGTARIEGFSYSGYGGALIQAHR